MVVVVVVVDLQDVGRPAVVLSKPHYQQLVRVAVAVVELEANATVADELVDFRFAVPNVVAVVVGSCFAFQLVAPNDSVVVVAVAMVVIFVASVVVVVVEEGVMVVFQPLAVGILVL